MTAGPLFDSDPDSSPDPDAPPPVLLAGATAALWMTGDGEVETLTPAEVVQRWRRRPPLLCHARATARRLGIDPFPAYDLLELYAFVRPAGFCPPVPRGLAQALGLRPPQSLDEQALLLPLVGQALLRELAARGAEHDRQALEIAYTMASAGWPWGPAVLQALGRGDPAKAPRVGEGFAIWKDLAEWTEQAPPPPPGSHPVDPEAARRRLAALLDEDAEARPQQADYASAVSAAFQPREREGEPNLVLAEAGTGVGKTLGYIAPASLWAERNDAPVWLSTFTRNLQRQIDDELDRLYPEAQEKAGKVVIRKGRENYLCLLNYAEAVRGIGGQIAESVIGLGLLARWIAQTRNGDMVGGDLPGWLVELAGRRQTLGLTDRRGECVYSACEFYRKCFIERSIRQARQADLVVANHALVMTQAALGGGEEGGLPSRYVFDEGHHLFAAADSAFAAHLSGLETHELRRWLLGAETRRTAGASRLRGLRRRLEDLVEGDQALQELLDEVLRQARCLAGDGWHARLAEALASGPCEAFLAAVRQQVYARAQRAGEGYSLECELRPVAPELLEAAAELDTALAGLLHPLARLVAKLAARLDSEAEELDSDSRRRIEAMLRGLERRGVRPLQAWRAMLAALAGETPEAFVDWLAVERIDGRDIDVGLYRHWIDPTEPFAETLLSQAQGVVVTSATLTDRSGEAEQDWLVAEARSGALHLPNPAIRARVQSPFDYAAQTRVFVVTDVRKDDLDQVAAALRELFLAAAGGGLGLFTAISRLRAVHARIARSLEEAGLALYAQHVDGLDVSTLIDIFRADVESCLLGTDAVRDGVDVPGRALRLIVFDRVPWPRPDLRHKARRAAFGGRRYDDMLTRLKLRQAYGRLVRRADDHGVFVLLDPMMPSRLATAFPEGVVPQRVGLAEALRETRAFLSQSRAGRTGPRE
jgi:ATP-dependent DNA helicase DinG